MQCNICVRRCELAPEGEAGYCGGYAVRDGTLTNIAYGRLALLQRQSVKDLPLSSWKEREECLAFGTYGCNARCRKCINWQWAHQRPGLSELENVQVWEPRHLAALAARHNLALATDFVEPVNLFDFVLDSFRLAKRYKVPTVLCTAGTLTESSLGKILPFTDVVRLDIKGWSSSTLAKQGFWRNGYNPKFRQTALSAIRSGCFLELTLCVIPSLTDDPEELQQIAHWVVSNLGSGTPLTLIGHVKAGPSDPWCKATADDLACAQSILEEAGLCRIHRYQIGKGVEG